MANIKDLGNSRAPLPVSQGDNDILGPMEEAER